MINRKIFVEPIATQREVADKLGITESAVAKIEARAINKLKKIAKTHGVNLAFIVDDNLEYYRVIKMKQSPKRCNECQYCGKDSISNYCRVSSLRLLNSEVESIRPTWCKLAFKQKVMFKKSNLKEVQYDS